MDAAAAAAEHGLKTPLLSLLQQDGQDGAHGCSMLQGGGGGRALPANMSPPNGSVGVFML